MAAAARRHETIQWLMFQMGGIGPMFGQAGFFHKFAGKDFKDTRPRDRCIAEARCLMGVLNQHLDGRNWIMGEDYTIADIATFPKVRNLIGYYGAGELVGFGDFSQVARALDTFVARPAVVRGLQVPGTDYVTAPIRCTIATARCAAGDGVRPLSHIAYTSA